MPIDPVIIQARLAAAKHDTGVFAAAYREHVPELVKLSETCADALLTKVQQVYVLVGALLDVEFTESEDGGILCTGPGCDGGEDHEGARFHRTYGAPPCSVDAALTAAGFPDQASRDAERARRANR